ncbi:hypothetical protein M703_04795 [Neisseria gonorrhoeae SK29344]|uniref:Uncharacterized protein n=1 Tax=Neisseria gonorrhoeae 3502 TaxID=1193404 RepID=A0AA44ZHB4_NEIGO|nr:hypothetical protein T556_08200 [Neisseria gonorrhoeae NG-k51.05]KAE9493739.1 hypothetical protein F9Z35_1685 [Neisseria gonorrhoeae]KLR75669.1 hypothetical protein M717_13145 [Neisseria gonorrhoeae SK33414]KLR78580.1 hypothetical protein M679_04450 [Neisseria gonorrhoeae SK7842]KLR81379.1 hypothetical protein M680_06475 [Neisseria gonorrhoeae SK8976]KLR85280.1 hypothetical protein M684_08460 [Neisseria gonorrhoeae SK15454]KLR86253.1 hypothetical protein M675_08540 [Neisseria gonorrhoeae S
MLNTVKKICPKKPGFILNPHKRFQTASDKNMPSEK